MIRRLAAVAGLALVVGSCGGGSSRLADDLLLVTRVVEVSPEAVTFVGRDVAGNVAEVGNDPEPRVFVYEVNAADARILATFPEAGPPPDTIRFGRDSLSFAPLDVLTAGADRVVLLLRPLIDPTRGGVGFEALAVAVGADGQVLASDWQGEDEARLEAVVDGDAAGRLAGLVGALSRRVRGEPLSTEDRALLDAVGAG